MTHIGAYLYPPIGYYAISLRFQKKASSSRRAVIFWSEPKTYQFYPKVYQPPIYMAKKV